MAEGQGSVRTFYGERSTGEHHFISLSFHLPGLELVGTISDNLHSNTVCLASAGAHAKGLSLYHFGRRPQPAPGSLTSGSCSDCSDTHGGWLPLSQAPLLRPQLHLTGWVTSAKNSAPPKQPLLWGGDSICTPMYSQQPWLGHTDS